METKELTDSPPVLIDIGASGGLLSIWKKIAKYSICIGFDADDRETDFDKNNTNSEYKKMYIFNKLVSDSTLEKNNFYLTKSPFCSSSLKPDNNNLSSYAFSNLFKVINTIEIQSLSLSDALQEVGIEYVDWFKTDSQGTDLKIFTNLDDKIIQNVIVADFEPGIIDAYIGEDKIYDIMKYMDNKGFWVSNCDIKGSPRIKFEHAKQKLKLNKLSLIECCQKISPGWVELSYFSSFNDSEINKRKILLGCAFSILKKQYGFALELSEIGINHFNEPIFYQINDFCLKKMKQGLIKRFPLLVVKRLYQKFF